MRLVTLAQNGYLPSPTVLDETKDVKISKEPQFDGIRPFFTSTNTDQIDGSSALISATQVRAGLQGVQVASSPAMPLDATYPNNKWKPSQHDIEVSDYLFNIADVEKVGQIIR